MLRLIFPPDIDMRWRAFSFLYLRIVYVAERISHAVLAADSFGFGEDSSDADEFDLKMYMKIRKPRR